MIKETAATGTNNNKRQRRINWRLKLYFQSDFFGSSSVLELLFRIWCLVFDNKPACWLKGKMKITMLLVAELLESFLFRPKVFKE